MAIAAVEGDLAVGVVRQADAEPEFRFQLQRSIAT